MGDESIEVEPERQDRELERHASESRRGIVGEFVAFLLHNKKWWLVPIIVVLLLVAVLLVLGGTGVGPLIYTLF